MNNVGRIVLARVSSLVIDENDDDFLSDISVQATRSNFNSRRIFLKIVFVVTAGVVIVSVIVAVYIVPVIVTIVVLSVANVTLCRSSK